MKQAARLLVVGALIAGCGSGGSGSSGSALQKLDGKHLAGTSGQWIAIASPFKNPTNVSGTDTPPVQTNDVSNTVAFFEFPTPTAARSFYFGPPIAAHLIASGIQAYQPLRGATGVPHPSRGLDLRECLWKGGAGQGGAGRGTPSGGSMTSSGSCTRGTPSSAGVAIIAQRDRYVVLSEAFGNTVIGGSAPAAALSNPSLGASKHANSALALMEQSGLKLN